MTYGYIRVSTDKQDVENQKIGINRKAEELGLSVEKWIADEGVSGMKEYNKRNLGVLMKKIQEGDILIISEISRLARSVFMLFRIIELCNERKVVIYSVKDSINTVKPNDLTSMMMLFCFGIAAQIERNMIVERTKEGLERRKQAGVILGRPLGTRKPIPPQRQETIDEIKKYAEKGLGFTAIGTLLDMNRFTVRSIILKYGFGINAKASENMKKRWNSGEFDHLRGTLYKEKDYIMELINEGFTNTQIIAKLQKEKGHNYCESKIRRFINETPEIRNLLIQRQNEIRPIANAECGKNKGRYRY